MSYTLTIEAPDKAAWFEEQRSKMTPAQLGELFVKFLLVQCARMPHAESVGVKLQKSARELIGYGRRFHKLRTTEEWMRELREGEDSLTNLPRCSPPSSACSSCDFGIIVALGRIS